MTAISGPFENIEPALTSNSRRQFQVTILISRIIVRGIRHPLADKIFCIESTHIRDMLNSHPPLKRAVGEEPCAPLVPATSSTTSLPFFPPQSSFKLPPS